jgi:fimbrial isopeptide formation D2 family protein
MKPLDMSTIEVDKKIWSGTAWVDTINADIDDIAQFKIRVTFHESCGHRATNIVVSDTLPPCLEYSGDAVIVHGGNTFAGESEVSGNLVTWNLTEDYGIELWDTNKFPSKSRSVSIEFNATVIGYTSQTGENNMVDVTALERCCGVPLEGHDEATVTITDDVMPTIEVTKTANPEEIAEPGGLIIFTIEVENTGIEAVTLTSLVDDIYGDLNGMGDCVLPQIIAAGNTYTCSFQATVMGNAGDSETDTVIALAEDDVKTMKGIPLATAIRQQLL